MTDPCKYAQTDSFCKSDVKPVTVFVLKK
uniref:Uncharacterized protein n=1 Tax=Anguilla anguilla TaxID=7936 RepID=A0A0E9XW54_ANGAN